MHIPRLQSRSGCINNETEALLNLCWVWCSRDSLLAVDDYFFKEIEAINNPPYLYEAENNRIQLRGSCKRTKT